MKVLHLNVSDLYGGASRAAYRLHTGLKNTGVDSKMLVQFKQSKDPDVYGAFLSGFFPKTLRFIDRIPVFFKLKRVETTFHLQWVPDFITKQINIYNPDIIHLHWICGGFVRIESFAQFQRPIVWTLHDKWAFTGGCHLSGDCRKYEGECGTCPQLNSTHENDLSRKTINRKINAWKEVSLNIVTPSRWLETCAKRSTVLKRKNIINIPNGIDISLFMPEDKVLARKRLGLPLNKKLILFGGISATDNKLKGFQHLTHALKTLGRNMPGEKPELITFGSSERETGVLSGVNMHSFGNIDSDKMLSRLYSACDVFIAPSKEDNLPNTVMESISCGTPCVAFDIGGMKDMITHQKNGYLAKPFDVHDLAKGILWAIASEDCWKNLSRKAREKAVEKFAVEKVAKQYTDLYRKIKKNS